MADLYLAPISSPCKDCPNRSFACHDSCCLYQDYKEQLTDTKSVELKAYSSIAQAPLVRVERRTTMFQK